MDPTQATPFDTQSKPSFAAKLLGVSGDLLAACVIAAAVVAINYMRQGLLGLDGYYHIRMAELYSTGEMQAAGGNFHWTRFSSWNGNFSDKDYLWHILLIPFIKIFGSDPQSLVHAATAGTAFTAGLIGLILARVLRGNGVRWPFIWTLLLVAGSEAILFRLSMPRSYLLSIAFALLGWQVITRRSRLAIVAVGALYALAYTAPHLLMAMAGLWGLIELMAGDPRPLSIDDKGESADTQSANASGQDDAGPQRRPFVSRARFAFTPLAFATLGVAIGLALHPQPVNMLKMWVIQNIGVLADHWGALDFASAVREWAGAAPNPNGIEVSDYGRELLPMSSRDMLARHLIGFALLIAPWMLRSIFAEGVRKPDRVDAFAWSCTLVFFALMMMSQRFAEYFYPFAILSAARTLAPALQSQGAADFLERCNISPKAAVVLPTLAMLALVAARPQILNNAIEERDEGNSAQAVGANERQNQAHYELAMAIKEHVPARDAEGNQTAIYTPSWGEFTQLFFWAPEYDYLCGLDPSFMLAYSPERYQDYAWIRDNVPKGRGPKLHPEQSVLQNFGMRYMIVMPKSRPQLAHGIDLRIKLTRFGPKPATLLASGDDDSWRLYRIEDFAAEQE